MIRGRRRQHRRTWMPLAIVMVLVYTLALLDRKPVPPMESLPVKESNLATENQPDGERQP